MPPSMPNPNKRMTANPARPVARYRPGKAIHQEVSSDEDDYESEDNKKQAAKQQKSQPQSQRAPQKPKAPIRPQQDDDDDEEGFVTDEEDEAETGAVPKDIVRQATATQSQHDLAGISQQSEVRAHVKPETESESEDEEDSDEEEEEEDSSSEDEAPRRKFQRPTFIKKTDRQAISGSTAPDSVQDTSLQASNSAINNGTASSSTADVDEQLRRRAQAELLIQDKLERDAIARAAGKKHWDDDDDFAPEELVDDTDGLDPEAEHQAWKLRELRRLKRDREAIEAREREIEEIERRRNLTAEERDREDEEFIAKQRAEREQGRSQTGFMARYHHKGAFFLDDENAELLKQRDIMGARFEDEVQDKSTLPEYMRIRDMTKLGRKGRTRYTDLKGQDTGRFGDEVKRWRGAGDGNRTNDFPVQTNGGVDERFLPDHERPAADRGFDGRKRDDSGPLEKGSSTRRRSRSRSPKRGGRNDLGQEDRESRTDSYRPRRRSYSDSRSRSHSPPPRRKRSSSPYNDRDKRQKVRA